MRDKSKITSIMMACILHGFLIASLVFVFETSDANIPSRPLMIKAKIVKEENLITPEKKQERIRRQAEEEKRQKDIREENQRIEKEKKGQRAKTNIWVQKKSWESCVSSNNFSL